MKTLPPSDRSKLIAALAEIHPDELSQAAKDNDLPLATIREWVDVYRRGGEEAIRMAARKERKPAPSMSLWILVSISAIALTLIIALLLSKEASQ